MDLIPLILLIAAGIVWALDTIGVAAPIKLTPLGLLLAAACVPLYYMVT